MRCGGLALLLLALAGPGSGGPSGPGGQGGQGGGGGGGCPPADRAVERRGAPDNSSLDGGCAACRLRSEVRQMSLAAIREHVLARLGFAHAPNTTGRVLPSAPQDMLLKFERGRQQEMDMQADQPHKYSYHEDEDDFHARTEKVIAFPHRGQFYIKGKVRQTHEESDLITGAKYIIFTKSLEAILRQIWAPFKYLIVVFCY